MKRTRIAPDLSLVPEEFRPLLSGSAVYDSSCSPEAQVWYVERDGGYYLKSAPKGSLKTEAAMTDYFHGKGLGARILSYRSGDRDWLLSSRVPGEDCTFGAYLDDPSRLSVLLGERLRMLHELSFDGCPVPDRMDSYFAVAAKNYGAGRYDLSYFPEQASPEEIYGIVARCGKDLSDRVLLHGDYCLPNVILDRWRFSGFVDVGNGGVGDRHIDLFWGAWTLNYNLKTEKYRSRFFDAYGRDLVDPEKLRIVAAAEVFG